MSCFIESAVMDSMKQEVQDDLQNIASFAFGVVMTKRWRERRQCDDVCHLTKKKKKKEKKLTLPREKISALDSSPRVLLSPLLQCPKQWQPFALRTSQCCLCSKQCNEPRRVLLCEPHGWFFFRVSAGDRMKRDTCAAAIALLLLSAAHCNDRSPPGRPVLLGCRSPEKETFTCRWEPGVDGGLPTAHRLYYQRERLEGTHECPDYRSAGSNSCFFDRSHTSIWVDYYLTVVASNMLGNATSDVFKVDVMEIVKPDAPERVTLTAEDRADSPSLRVSWEHPRDVDAGSGWVTPEYQIRARRRRRAGDAADWKEYKAGAQTHFTLYGVHPGAAFEVQARCRLDRGSWSSWSDSSYAEIPDRVGRDGPFWTSLSALSGLLFLSAVCAVVTKRKSVMRFLLPPVPGPKIRGLDFQLIKVACPNPAPPPNARANERRRFLPGRSTGRLCRRVDHPPGLPSRGGAEGPRHRAPHRVGRGRRSSAEEPGRFRRPRLGRPAKERRGGKQGRAGGRRRPPVNKQGRRRL
ncbi:prolactin receptor b isoform X2 [Hippocampus zosterae]|uniref:prolactin receptor b isoform X2 n=1 Tax=Hippocampus zosterae TaxID=109293 RepID=UPI00223C8FCA|nr:prolactin receptor b isoform X2 [Hippocampus zosterae]